MQTDLAVAVANVDGDVSRFVDGRPVMRGQHVLKILGITSDEQANGNA